jgi:hypothetical protein
MLDIKEINKEIKKLEESDRTNMTICERLSILYTVRDHFKNKDMVSQPTTSMMSNMMA